MKQLATRELNTFSQISYAKCQKHYLRYWSLWKPLQRWSNALHEHGIFWFWFNMRAGWQTLWHRCQFLVGRAPIYICIKLVQLSPTSFQAFPTERIFFEFFVDALDGLETQSKAKMKLNFSEIETTVKSKLNQNLAFPKKTSLSQEDQAQQIEDECAKKVE